MSMLVDLWVGVVGYLPEYISGEGLQQFHLE